VGFDGGFDVCMRAVSSRPPKATLGFSVVGGGLSSSSPNSRAIWVPLSRKLAQSSAKLSGDGMCCLGGRAALVDFEGGVEGLLKAIVELRVLVSGIVFGCTGGFGGGFIADADVVVCNGIGGTLKPDFDESAGTSGDLKSRHTRTGNCRR